MKTIIVMRHAKAESESRTYNDFDRKLNKKGIVAAQNCSKTLLEMNIKPDIIISSPALRALGTAEILARKFKVTHNLITKNYLFNRLYNFNEIIEDIIDTDNHSNIAAVIGHNPSISHLLKQIDINSDDTLSTSSIVVFDFDASTWQDVLSANCNRRCRIDKEDN
jgi:phosphohistidine phosphatase